MYPSQLQQEIYHLALWGALGVVGIFCEATLGSSHPNTLSNHLNLLFNPKRSCGLFQTSWFETGNGDLLSLVTEFILCLGGGRASETDSAYASLSWSSKHLLGIW